MNMPPVNDSKNPVPPTQVVGGDVVAKGARPVKKERIPGPDYRWLHPCHERALQSQNIERFAHLRKPLTDRKIDRYVKQGRLKYRPTYK